MPTTPTDNIIICDTESLCNYAQDFLLASKLIAADVETIPELQIMDVNGYSGVHDDGLSQTFVFPYYKQRNPASGPIHCMEKSFAVQQRINDSGIPVCMHNGAYDMFWYMRYNMPVRNYWFDSMYAWWAMYPELQKSLAFVSSILLDDYQYWKGDRKSDNLRTRLIYNGRDCERTLRVVLRLVDMMAAEPRVAENYAAAMRRVYICFGMSHRGMRVDESVRAGYGEKLEQQAAETLERLRYLVADSEFNPNSPKQKVRLFYQILGAQKRNAKGRPVQRIQYASAGKMPLRALRNEHPLFRVIANATLDAIEPAKQISNVMGLKTYGTKPRFYTSYNGTGTNTTRLSSSTHILMVGGNAQNIRKDYRGFIRAESGDHFILDIDYSAADDVNIAFESADPNKIELFRSGRDAHAFNASILFPNWTYDEIVAGKRAGDPRVVHPITGIRQITKRVAHGANYIMAAMTLFMTVGREAVVAAAQALGFEDAGYWPQDKLVNFCGGLDKLYRSHYKRLVTPGTKGSWYDELSAHVRREGGYTTPFNYYQRFLGDADDHATLRAIAATVGQAGTAGRINMTMDELVLGYIPPEFRDAPNPAYDDSDVCLIDHDTFGMTSLRLQTHDSLSFNIDHSDPTWKEAVRRIFKSMQRPIYIRNSQTGELEEVRINIEAEIGVGWGKGMVEVDDLTPEGVELALQSLPN